MANKDMNYSEGFILVTKRVTKSMTAQSNKISAYFCAT